ncbi:FimV/HubP family polar landmark protein [Halomonas llamarensis]|uniref:FimV N-terminal domain-containing protein n=1 Tax=Halomonas llamarensis TaxID=2945104 RepID=A0ABT0STZ0_9GAMM|nr:FimV/HubP family polar landmark protein [Halomonas llamarensis]MCL7931101.1 hypothetical protein [Halomonas llamarensis]
MKQPITLAMLFTLAMSSSWVHALGVGDAQVGSTLNAPLDASIPLVDAQQYSPETLSVRLAKRSAYASAGLEWSDVIADVNATLQGQPPTIRLTSSQSVDVPWLDLLLVIEYPSGRQAHEITLLFDPADYAAEGGQASQAITQSQSPQKSPQQFQPQSQRPSQTQSQRPSQRPASNRVVAESLADVSRKAVNARVNTRVNTSPYVDSGDTLWSVAERIKPEQASVQQMMVALLEANPHVFPSGNINGMRAGFRLDVPTDAQVMRRSAAASAEAIDAMNAAWRHRDNGLASVALPAPDTAATPDEDTQPSIADAAIASAEAVSSSGEVINPSGNADTSADSQPLEESQAMLAQLIEEREQMRSELDALRSQVSELTEALTSQERAGPSAADDVVKKQETARVADVESSRTEERVASAEDTQGMQQVDDAGVPASASAAGEAGGFPSLPALMENYRWTLMSAGLVLLLILLMLIRRRQAREWEGVDQASISEPSEPSKSQASTMTSLGVAQDNAPKQKASSAQNSQGAAFTAVEEELETEEAFETDPFTEPSPTIYAAQEAYAKDASPEAMAPDDSHPEPEAFEIDEPLEWEADDDDVLGRSQAAGLASQRSAALKESPETEGAPTTELKTEQEAEANKEVSPKPPEISSREQDTQSDSRFIDYQPPSLSAEPAAPRKETPMQPTVEFEPVETDEPQSAKGAKEAAKSEDSPADNRQKATKTDSDSPLGEGWEIEEVAFKVPGRDNARSP